MDQSRAAQASNPLDSRYSPTQVDPGRRADENPRVPDAITVLERAQQTADEMTAAIALFAQYMEQLRTPPRRGTFTFSTTQTRRRDDAGALHASYGVINPNAVRIYLGIGGEIAAPGSGAISVPENSVMVLPFAVADVELGVDPLDPDLAAGDVVVQTLRFNSVQPLFLGAL